MVLCWVPKRHRASTSSAFIVFVLCAKLSFDFRLSSRVNSPPSDDPNFHELPIINSVFGRSLEYANRSITEKLVELKDRPVISNGTTTNSNSPYVYAYVIGGCDPENPKYLGFLYNILISARILRAEGSTADIFAFFQISYSSAAQTLSDEDIRLLSSYNIKFRYLPKSEHESFYDTVLNKFQILGLTEYRRVLLMDGDVMPLGNIDYLFHFSDGPNATLKENLVLNGFMEPANAGFFMLTPHEGDLDHLHQIIHRRESKGLEFDSLIGWGHIIKPPDKWVSRQGEGTQWNFHFAESDQGLLYYWVKYFKKNVSIMSRNYRIENWGQRDDGNLHLEKVMENPFGNIPKPRFIVWQQCVKFICDVVHFVGMEKPWLRGPPVDFFQKPDKEAPKYVWYNELRMLNDELNMGLNLSDWKLKGVKPALGMFASRDGVAKRVEKALDKSLVKEAANSSAKLDAYNSTNAAYDQSVATELIRQNTSYLLLADPEKKSLVVSNATSSPYAYAYVIGGCDPENPKYLGYIYNILVSARILRAEGSTADIVVFFQISYKSPAETLSVEDLRLLESLSIKVRYLPKSEHESFYDTVLNKFQILGLTEYRRVLLMDGDVMPLANIDYLFHFSDEPNATLKENVVLNGMMEPANAGFFMLTPHEGDLDQIHEIIYRRESRGLKFDMVNGWGHTIKPPDKWVSRQSDGTDWNFHFAESDQGLLYYWVKYFKKNVSIISRNYRVENWGQQNGGDVHLEKVMENPFGNIPKPRFKVWQQCVKFICDVVHFSGAEKPWLRGPPEDFFQKPDTEAPKYLWYKELRILNEELNMGLNFTDWKLKGIRPALGMFASRSGVAKRVEKAMEKSRGNETLTATA